MSDYKNYLRREWQMFVSDKQRSVALQKAVGARTVRRVLDVGCGAGQEMLLFAEAGAFCIGVDAAPESAEVGTKLYAEKSLDSKVRFLTASGEQLPFAAESFDLIVCRVALVYMNCCSALTEMARVLRGNGVLLLKIHAPEFYYEKVWQALKNRQPLSALHAIRVLATGKIYSLTGKQMRGKLTASGETYLTRAMLEREINVLNLKITGEMSDTNRQTPSFIIEKQ